MKRLKKLFTSVAAICLSVLLVLTGCGDRSADRDGDQVTIRFSWWTNPTRTKMTQEAVKLFEEKHPDIKVVMEYSSWDSYWQKLATQTAGGGAPDVMQMDGSQLMTYISKGQLMDLSTVGVDSSDLSEETVQLGMVDGKLYGLATSINSQMFIYNPEIFEKAGVTFPEENYSWEELAELCVKIREKTGVYGMANEMEQTGLLSYFARTKGEELYSGNKIGLSKETLTEWFQYWLDLQEKGGVPTAEENAAYNHNDPSASPFIKEKTAINWLFLGTDPNYEESLGKPIGRALLPEWGNENKPYPLHGAMFWSMSSKTKHPEAAAKLINFLENDPEVAKIFKTDRGIPANQKNMEIVSETAEDETIQKQIDFMEKVKKVASPEKLAPQGSSEIADILKNLSQQVTFKEITPSEAAEAFIQQGNEALSQG
ncbi:MAG: ABC transporter substrate-binding protein [Planifilum sp.]|jgi:multiple sugar transport system substrate-binding protein